MQHISDKCVISIQVHRKYVPEEMSAAERRAMVDKALEQQHRVEQLRLWQKQWPSEAERQQQEEEEEEEAKQWRQEEEAE